MKKLLLLTLTAVVMAGCAKRNADGSIKLDSNITSPHVRTIDSCEYILWGYGMAHKGNCRYCAERRKQELKEMIKEMKE